MNDRSGKVKRGGSYAEKLVYYLLEGSHDTVIMSDDPFDPVKDMTADGKNVEVKFQEPYHYFRAYGMTSAEPAFTIPITKDNGKKYENQFDKCSAVDRLIFVENPGEDNKIRFWEAPVASKRRFYRKVNRKDGRTVAGILIRHCNLLAEVEDAKCAALLKENNVSNFK